MNRIGIENKSAESLSQKLGELLANYQVFYANVRGFHWNVKGNQFFELHAKFEELYNDLNLKVDELAERILTLGQTPEHRYSQYAQNAILKEVNETSNGVADVEHIVQSFEVLIKQQRELLELAGDAKDEGTIALMSDYIREQEKLVWMYSAFLNN